MTTDPITTHATQVKDILKEYKNISPIIPTSFLKTSPYVFNFSKHNTTLSLIDLNNAEEFIGYINETIKQSGCEFGIGGYGENRIIYRRSNLFDNNTEPRSMHLGVDLWLPEGTPIKSPLPAIIHSFQDNNNFGDYGPTIILEHSLNEIKFYTLYGHLSRASLKNMRAGMEIKQGQPLATVGNYNENGQWPSHLHFQIISNMLDKHGDFPGVASLSQKKYYLTLCPDPNLILKINLE